MSRAFLCVLDSVGCGGAPDAAAFGDEGANTLGHIAQACAEGRADEGRSGPLTLPNLDALGLGRGDPSWPPTAGRPPGLMRRPQGRWGAATEVSNGKDTPSGHWELAGVPVPFDWHYFPREVPAFPTEITDEIITRAGPARHPGQLPFLRHADHPCPWGGAHPDRQADLLHLRRQRLSDRRA